MSHLAHRGQAPAKGILHGVYQRQPMRKSLNADGQLITVADPRGYFAGQHVNAVKNERRAVIKAAGGIRQFKKQRRAA